MTRATLAPLLLALSSCRAPSPADRTAAYIKLRDVTRAECLVGQNDPAMPADVKAWCAEVEQP